MPVLEFIDQAWQYEFQKKLLLIIGALVSDPFVICIGFLTNQSGQQHSEFSDHFILISTMGPSLILLLYITMLAVFFIKMERVTSIYSIAVESSKSFTTIRSAFILSFRFENWIWGSERHLIILQFSYHYKLWNWSNGTQIDIINFKYFFESKDLCLRTNFFGFILT